MFESTRRSFRNMSGSELGQQYDPCVQYANAMKIYGQKISHFNQQMQQALARGDIKSFGDAAGIAQDAAKKWEEQRRLLEQCRRKQRALNPYDIQQLPVIPRTSPGTYSPFRPAPAPVFTPTPPRIPFSSFWPMFS